MMDDCDDDKEEESVPPLLEDDEDEEILNLFSPDVMVFMVSSSICSDVVLSTSVSTSELFNN